MSLSRRSFVKGTAAASLATVSAPAILRAQGAGAMRVGLLTVKTGPLASGGIDMERSEGVV